MGTTRNGKHIIQESDESDDDEVAFYNGFIKFNEVWDPVAAMMWISHMEDAFKVMNCSDEEKATYAVTMLRSEALVWWDAVKDTSVPETTTKMTWSRFKEVFKDEFYPAIIEVELVQQLRTLKQGRNESIQKYTACFRRLWWFFCYLTNEKRIIYFYVGGLAPYIKDFISTSDMTSLESAIKAARLIDEEYKRTLEENKDFKKKRARRTCTNRVKTHKDECRYGAKGCYRCGELGHLARECCSYY